MLSEAKGMDIKMKDKDEKTSILKKLYNIYRWLYLKNMKVFSYILYKLTFLMLGCTVPPSAKLEKGVNFGHPIGIVIHQNAIIGKNTLIYQNVTIGRKDLSSQKCPVIGENCVIGAGACLLGDISIGNNVTIGANAVVITDVPDNSVAIGVPAQIRSK